MRYAVSYRCAGTGTSQSQPPIDAPDGPTALKAAMDGLEEWVRDGDWGEDGALIDARCRVTDEHGEEWDDFASVAIEPQHDRLIRRAGGDPDCDHEWTSAHEGGCHENPGVWSTTGTTLVYHDHCTHCGLRRHVTRYGSQRNPGQADRIEYFLPDEEIN